MKKCCVLLLGANQFQRQRALIGAEKTTDAKIITVSEKAPFINSSYASITLHSCETDPARLLVDTVRFIENSRLNLLAVVPLNDFVLNAGHAVANKYGLIYHSKKTIELCRTKDLMKKALAEASLPVVQSHRFYDYESAKHLAQSIGFPVVIKPLNFGGSGGVKKVDNEVQLKFAINETLEHLHQYAEHYDSDTQCLLMEKYISQKREISVEVLNTPQARYVIGITDKFLADEPYFSEVGHQVPSSLYVQYPDSVIDTINKIAMDACAALNIQYGMAHVEMRISEAADNPIIVEVGARTAGDGIMDLYEKATGINIYKLHCHSYLNTFHTDMLPKQFINMAAVGYLHPNAGTITEINYDQLSVEDMANVDAIVLKATVGQEVTDAKNWSSRYGYVEYIFWNTPFFSFNIVKKTKHIADKLLRIKKSVSNDI